MEPAEPEESLPTPAVVVPPAIAPSGSAPTPSIAPSLPSLPASAGELTGRTSVASPPPPPLLDDPPSLLSGSAVALASLEEMARHAASPSAREDLWRPIARALAVFMLALLALRLVFDEFLSRIVFVLAIGVCSALLLAMLLHAIALARRQRVLLLAFTQLTRLAKSDPNMAATLAPRIDEVLASLRAEPRMWPFPSRD